ncbi:MAG: GH3 auxin-responsive promoter family protein [Peptostreptococcaceae bacterium]|nr:GH3 auxin-responsive promoter family protein [Peptostreptococcaceae bacterium]
MKYGDKLKNQSGDALWNEYCDFLNLSISDFMAIQTRLIREQLPAWLNSELGSSIANARIPKDLTEFRDMIPLTSYDDYSDILLNKNESALPEKPVIWLETTWEGGKHPIKTAPYTQGMIDVFRNNLLSVTTLSSTNKDKRSRLKSCDNVLFGLAPLPYVTGLFPLVFEEELNLNFLPPVSDAHTMSFGDRNRKGFAMGVEQGIDAFFGLSSVIHYMTKSFENASGSKSGSKHKLTPKMALRCLNAKLVCEKEQRNMLPKDIFKLKALLCAGTDTSSYKDYLEEAWGIAPHEVFAGTELSMIATETHTHNGLVLFPDVCLYEFIPESEYQKNRYNPNYVPKTCLIDEIEEGHNYELVITSLKGGAFARYRMGDMFSCYSKTGDTSTSLPLLKYVDRAPTVIDIAGFTRITEKSITDVIDLSRLPIEGWFAKKEYDNNKTPYLHLYIEIKAEDLDSTALSCQLLQDHLKAYFKFFDTDYNDLEKMLGIKPLVITVIKSGSISLYKEYTGNSIDKMNPKTHDIRTFLKWIELHEKDGRILV